MKSKKFDSTYTDYQTQRSSLRRWLRQFYLQSARGKLGGATMDFGCGVGELLATLPPGSMGLEYNQATVEYCRARGLDVSWYDGTADDWSLSAISPGRSFETMIISHVLEHLDDPLAVLRCLLNSAYGYGVRKVLVIVPGKAGFQVDHTHRTFVDRTMLSAATETAGSRFRYASASYFPGNIKVMGDWFPHHELQVIYESNV